MLAEVSGPAATDQLTGRESWPPTAVRWIDWVKTFNQPGCELQWFMSADAVGMAPRFAPRLSENRPLTLRLFAIRSAQS